MHVHFFFQKFLLNPVFPLPLRNPPPPLKLKFILFNFKKQVCVACVVLLVLYENQYSK